ncbi:MAG: DUF2975 domain-containing protein [Eubacteriaceae bacterium]|jgi:hypothetical protein|nr:DUF2975 domain-containing protein [Eubacteriaceae bacterium]
MWNERKSILLSKIVVIAIIVTIPVLGGFLPTLIQQLLCSGSACPIQSDYYTVAILIPYGVMALPGLVLMAFLYKLLQNIDNHQLFIEDNVSLLRRISWLCFLIAAVAILATGLWWAWSVLAIAAVLIGLLVRVIKNIFARAIIIKEENDYTI